MIRKPQDINGIIRLSKQRQFFASSSLLWEMAIGSSTQGRTSSSRISLPPSSQPPWPGSFATTRMILPTSGCRSTFSSLRRTQTRSPRVRTLQGFRRSTSIRGSELEAQDHFLWYFKSRLFMKYIFYPEQETLNSLVMRCKQGQQMIGAFSCFVIPSVPASLAMTECALATFANDFVCLGAHKR